MWSLWQAANSGKFMFSPRALIPHHIVQLKLLSTQLGSPSVPRRSRIDMADAIRANHNIF